jgi:HNH endonuclease
MQFKQNISDADDNNWFSAQEYCDALIKLGKTITPQRRRMLAAHAVAPASLLSVSQLAASIGYIKPNVVYSQYGKLGGLLAKAMGAGEQTGVQTRIIGADTRNESGEVTWAMHPELVEALMTLKWTEDCNHSDSLVGDFDGIGEIGDAFFWNTEREAVIKARICQGVFRTDLIKYWGSCAVTGISEPAVLRASHIKPWRLCNNHERLDPFNGLLLAAHIDALFDKGLITFEFDGLIRFSPLLAQEDILLLGMLPTMRLRRITEEHKGYLHHHHQEFRFGVMYDKQ